MNEKRSADVPSALGPRASRPPVPAITLRVNGKPVTVPQGTMVSAALAQVGATVFRRSVTGEPRGPFCGMGICFECRVTIDAQPHCRSCQTLCRDGMDVRTDA